MHMAISPMSADQVVPAPFIDELIEQGQLARGRAPWTNGVCVARSDGHGFNRDGRKSHLSALNVDHHCIAIVTSIPNPKIASRDEGMVDDLGKRVQGVASMTSSYGVDHRFRQHMSLDPNASLMAGDDVAGHAPYQFDPFSNSHAAVHPYPHRAMAEFPTGSTMEIGGDRCSAGAVAEDQRVMQGYVGTRPHEPVGQDIRATHQPERWEFIWAVFACSQHGLRTIERNPCLYDKGETFERLLRGRSCVNKINSRRPDPNDKTCASVFNRKSVCIAQQRQHAMHQSTQRFTSPIHDVSARPFIPGTNNSKRCRSWHPEGD